MTSRKKNKVQAAYGDWTIVTDGKGHITECYGTFGGEEKSAQAHAKATATYINSHYTWHDKQTDQVHYPNVVAEWDAVSRSCTVQVPPQHAKSFIAWLQDHRIPVTEEKDEEKLWVLRTKPKGHSGQGFFSDPNPPRRR